MKLARLIFLVACALNTSISTGEQLHGLDNSDAWEQNSSLFALASEGDSNAQYILGLNYFNGEGGFAKDYKKAAEWLRKASEQGNSDAQGFLGVMYLDGQGVEKDYGLAFKWLEKAAESSKANAQAMLGYLYSTGEGVDRNPTKAIELYTQAAEQGHVTAQSQLGLLYSRRLDFVRGYAWLDVAASQGDEMARKNRDVVYDALSPAQYEKARQLSSEISARIRKKQ